MGQETRDPRGYLEQQQTETLTREEVRAIIDARRLVAIAESDSDNLSVEGRYLLHWVRRRLAERVGPLFKVVTFDRL